MKKVVLLAVMALSLSAMAQQHVKPLAISLAEVKLDSLRVLYSSEPMMYRASLDVVASDLKKNADEIKAAKAELKEEQSHAQEIDNTLKDASKTVNSLKGLYNKEEAELKTMQKNIEQL